MTCSRSHKLLVETLHLPPAGIAMRLVAPGRRERSDTKGGGVCGVAETGGACGEEEFWGVRGERISGGICGDARRGGETGGKIGGSDGGGDCGGGQERVECGGGEERWGRGGNEGAAATLSSSSSAQPLPALLVRQVCVVIFLSLHFHADLWNRFDPAVAGHIALPLLLLPLVREESAVIADRSQLGHHIPRFMFTFLLNFVSNILLPATNPIYAFKPASAATFPLAGLIVKLPFFLQAIFVMSERFYKKSTA